jgi:Tol biopolymer transport system component
MSEISMSALHLAPRRALVALAAVLAAGCSPDAPAGPGGGPPPTEGLAARAVAVRVDLVAGTATVVDRPGTVASPAAASFALLGANEIGAVTTSPSRSAVGQFIAKKVRIKFTVALTNRTSVALLTPTFPTPPAGTHSVMLFPFATTLTGGSGAIDPSPDWNGEGTPGSGAPLNFFNDASCSSGARSDCYRWQGFPAPFAAGATTASDSVGFDVDPTVLSFTTYFVLAADLEVPGSISGIVSSPQRGPLGHVTVTLTPGNRFTGTSNSGAYGFTGIAPGNYTVSLSGLPGYCEPAAPQTVGVASGAGATANFSVQCPYIAFSSDRSGHFEIYRMNLDGTGQTRLTNGTCSASNPTWSPDGTRIAYGCSRAGGIPEIGLTDIIVMNADGTNPVTITDGTTRNTEPDWGPDGRIVFSSYRDGNDELYAMNADGSNAVRLTQTPDSGEFQPSWSGDGSHIAFTKTGYKRTTDTLEPDGNIVWTMNADGTGGGLLFASQFGDARDPAWSPVPGSNLVAFWAATGCCPNGDAIFTADAVTKTARQLIDPKTQMPQLAFAPDWSTDGTRIVFSGLAGSATAYDIYIMGADGSGITNLTNIAGSDSDPAWQP